jgi:hypothetical protein
MTYVLLATTTTQVQDTQLIINPEQTLAEVMM